ncbi:MAG: OmpH family outer membrane protein [bacterium]|nr:OmpH family outer membrane protein [bacterium]
MTRLVLRGLSRGRILAVAIGLAGLALMAAEGVGTGAVGVIDADLISKQSTYVQQELAKASADAQSLQDQLKARQAEYEKAVTQYNSQQSAATAQVNDQRKADIERIEKEVGDLQQKFNAALAEAQNNRLGPIRERIKGVVADVARERGIQVVLASQGVVYMTPAADLSAEVIRRLDAGPAAP